MLFMRNRLLTLWLAGFIILVFIVQNLFGLDLAWTVGTVDVRFFTSMVAHSSMAHLLGNLFALLLFGLLLEQLVGTKRFAFVLLSAGIVGNLAGIGTYTKVLGISGAIYGILGALVLLRPRMTIWAFGMPMPMAVAGVAWIIGSVLGLFANTNTGHLAHLAGIMVGFIIGLAWRKDFPEERKPRKRKHDPLLEHRLDIWERIYMR